MATADGNWSGLRRLAAVPQKIGGHGDRRCSRCESWLAPLAAADQTKAEQTTAEDGHAGGLRHHGDLLSGNADLPDVDDVGLAADYGDACRDLAIRAGQVEKVVAVPA